MFRQAILACTAWVAEGARILPAVAALAAVLFAPAAAAEPRTAEALAQLCDARDWPACEELAARLEVGAGVAEDVARAARLYGRACDAGHAGACTSIGFLHESGRGMPRDAARAVALYERACALGDGYGCEWLARMHEERRFAAADPARAAELKRRACELGTRACRLAALRQAAGSWPEACEQGDASACTQAGNAIEQGGESRRPDPERAAYFYRKGCDAGAAASCLALAVLYDMGQGVFKDLATAAGFYGRACEAGSAQGCRSLALLYETGEGVELSAERAAELMRRACALGDRDSCQGS